MSGVTISNLWQQTWPSTRETCRHIQREKRNSTATRTTNPSYCSNYKGVHTKEHKKEIPVASDTENLDDEEDKEEEGDITIRHANALTTILHKEELMLSVIGPVTRLSIEYEDLITTTTTR